MSHKQQLITIEPQNSNGLFDYDERCVIEVVKMWEEDTALSSAMERVYRHLKHVNGENIDQADDFIVQLDCNTLEIQYNLALNRLLPLQDKRSELNIMDDDTYYKYIIDQYLIPFAKCMAACKQGNVVYFKQTR